MGQDEQKFIEINKEPQQKLLSYFLRYPEKAVLFPFKYFVSIPLRQIAESIIELQELDIEFNLDELTTICKQKNNNIKYEQILNIQEAFDDFENIDYVKQVVKSQYIKFGEIPKLTEDIFVNLSSDGAFDNNKLKDLANNLLLKIYD
jgi:hypothetical protein